MGFEDKLTEILRLVLTVVSPGFDSFFDLLNISMALTPGILSLPVSATTRQRPLAQKWTWLTSKRHEQLWDRMWTSFGFMERGARGEEKRI